jgi:hypothetical protein
MRDPILPNWEFFESIFLPGSDVQRVLNEDTTVWPMFVERKICYSALLQIWSGGMPVLLVTP